MKKLTFNKVRLAVAVCAAGLLLGAISLNAEPVNIAGGYTTIDMGVNLASKLAAGSNSLNINGVSGATISLDTGFRVDAVFGYGIKLSDQVNLAPELEIGCLYNQLNQATGGGKSSSVGGEFVQVPFMVNGDFHFMVTRELVLYAGGGVGVDCMFLSANAGVLGGEADFAWQAFCGVQYKVGAGELGVGYKILETKPNGCNLIANNTIALSYTFHF